MSTDHKSVLIKEIVKAFAPKDGQAYLDATFGAGGYSRALLAAADVDIYAIDRDPLTATYAYAMKNTKFFNTSFSKLHTLSLPLLDGIVFDLGISSMQIDRPARGFSYDKDGPLDMRMNNFGTTAGDFINNAPEEKIAEVLDMYGEEPKAKQVAKAIVANRPLRTTLELANLVQSVVPKVGRAHPAARTFQAIRIYINDELAEIRTALPLALKYLKPGGKLLVVTFHSLEDRIVKRFMEGLIPKKKHVNKYKQPKKTKEEREAEKNAPKYKILFAKPIVPTPKERAENPRSRSAKLRGVMLCPPSK